MAGAINKNRELESGEWFYRSACGTHRNQRESSFSRRFSVAPFSCWFLYRDLSYWLTISSWVSASCYRKNLGLTADTG